MPGSTSATSARSEPATTRRSPTGPARFAPVEPVALKPTLALRVAREIMDLAGDGQPDVVVLDGPIPGFYEHDDDDGWTPFRPFASSHPCRHARPEPHGSSTSTATVTPTC